MSAIRIGAPGRTHLVLRPTRRVNPESDDYWERNWLAAIIDIAAGRFRASINAMVRAEELVVFREQLRRSYADVSLPARFDTLEGWLTIDIAADGRGHFHARCVAMDEAGIGNKLQFGIDFDQTDLPEMLYGLDTICAEFPELGPTSDQGPKT